MGARFARRIDFVYGIREIDVLATFVQQRNIEIARVDQATHDPMYCGVEILLALWCACQFCNAKQGRLKALAALTLQHLLAQHAIGRAQGCGAIGDATFQFCMRFAPFQRGLHMLRDVVEQVAIVPRVMRIGAVALHGNAAHRLAAAQQRYAQPVFAARTDQDEAAFQLARQFFDRTHDGLRALQQVPCEAVPHVLQRVALVRRRRLLVDRIDVIRKAHAVRRRVVQEDVEVLRVHQHADDGVQRLHHLGHVVRGAGQFGDGIERALQALGHGQARDGLIQAAGFTQLAQAGSGKPSQPGQFGRDRLVQLGRIGHQHQGLQALGIFGQAQPAGYWQLVIHFRRKPTQFAVDAEVAQGGLAGFQHAAGVYGPEQLFHALTQLRRDSPGGFQHEIAGLRH